MRLSNVLQVGTTENRKKYYKKHLKRHLQSTGDALFLFCDLSFILHLW